MSPSLLTERGSKNHPLPLLAGGRRGGSCLQLPWGPLVIVPGPQLNPLHRLPPSPSAQVLPPGTLLDKNRTRQEAPDCTQKGYDTLAYDEVRQLRRRRRFARKNSEAASETHSSAMDGLDRSRARDSRDELPDVAGKRNRVDELRRAVASGGEVVRDHA